MLTRYHFHLLPHSVDTTLLETSLVRILESVQHFCYILHQVQLPTYVENVREKLAENIHELWAMGKVEAGWSFGEVSKLISEYEALILSTRVDYTCTRFPYSLAFDNTNITTTV